MEKRINDKAQKKTKMSKQQKITLFLAGLMLGSSLISAIIYLV